MSKRRPRPDYSTWLSKQAAADAIGVSTKTIEKFVKNGVLDQATWRRPSGGMPIAVYDPDDVVRLAHARQPARPYVVPGGRGMSAPPTEALARLDDELGISREVFIQAVRAFTAHTEAAVKPILTLKEAAKVSGWSQAFLRRAIKEGRLPAEKDRGLRIRRRDLDQL
jgi:excisionase family DNA binding protein